MEELDWESPVERESGYKSSPTPVDWTLVPFDAVYQIGETLTKNCDEYGGKYSRDNWRKSEWKDQLNGMMNHVARLIAGEGDEEEHVNHVATRALMMLAQYSGKKLSTSTSSPCWTQGHSEVGGKTLNRLLGDE